MLNYFFQYVEFSYLGLSQALSFYQVYICRDPDGTKCSDYLNLLTNTSQLDSAATVI